MNRARVVRRGTEIDLASLTRFEVTLFLSITTRNVSDGRIDDGNASI